MSQSPDKGCPYGEPPRIEQQDGGEWTINGKPRLKGDPACQVIMVSADACATCPLAAPPESEHPPSAFLAHIVYLSDLQAIGIGFAYGQLTQIEMEGLRLLKRKQNEKQIKDLKAKR